MQGMMLFAMTTLKCNCAPALPMPCARLQQAKTGTDDTKLQIFMNVRSQESVVITIQTWHRLSGQSYYLYPCRFSER